jgi:hypothetical protein
MDAGLDAEHHAGPDHRLVPDIEERRLVTTTSPGRKTAFVVSERGIAESAPIWPR